MNQQYITIEELFKSEKLIKPEILDHLLIEKDGIKFYIYGILHGITGGTNQEYKNFVNKTIFLSKGLKISEKSMKKMYDGLDLEVDDWLEVPFKDAFKLTFKLFTSPISTFDIIKTVIKEKITKLDRFNTNEIRRFQDLGGSAFFHTLNPFDRRLYMGFPNSQTYFLENINRRNSNQKISSISMADKDWSWLSHIEPFVNIPFRSIHMFEKALELAKSNGYKEVSLFVGETHNTDIIWYLNRETNNPIIEEEIYKIKNKLTLNKFYKYLNKLKYFGAVALASSIPMIIILLFFIYFYKI